MLAIAQVCRFPLRTVDLPDIATRIGHKNTDDNRGIEREVALRSSPRAKTTTGFMRRLDLQGDPIGIVEGARGVFAQRECEIAGAVIDLGQRAFEVVLRQHDRGHPESDDHGQCKPAHRKSQCARLCFFHIRQTRPFQAP